MVCLVYSRPGSNVFYTVLYGNEITTLLNRAALDQHVTSRTSGYKILYMRSYNSRTCVYVIYGDLRMVPVKNHTRVPAANSAVGL